MTLHAFEHADELAAPEDLNGALHVWLLPLDLGEHVPGLAEVEPGSPDGSDSAFLPGRASCRNVGGWTSPRPGQPWRYAEPVLLASAEQRLAPEQVVFGRSKGTLRERSAFDQPLFARAARCASLWHVDGAGFVLALERLFPLAPGKAARFAHELDELGQALVEPRDEHSTEHDSASASVEALLKHFTGDSSVTLADLLGAEVTCLPPVPAGQRDPASTPLRDLVVYRRTAIAGRRQAEGMLVGVAASTESLGIEKLLLRGHQAEDRDFADIDEHQQAGFNWSYAPLEVAGVPATPGALSAVRSDGRVLVVDLDSYSVYHDYTGWGGRGTVLQLVPLVAVLGQRVGDVQRIANAISLRTVDHEDTPEEQVSRLSPDLDMARRTRARVQLRRLRGERPHERNFNDWTNDDTLRRNVAFRALADAVDGAVSQDHDAEERLVESIDVLEKLLDQQLRSARTQVEGNRAQAEAARARSAEQSRSALQAVAGVVTGAGLLGLFAALAAVPQDDRVLPSLTNAALWTLLAAVIVGFMTVGGWRLLQARPPHSRWWRSSTYMLAVASLGLAVAGLLVGRPIDASLLAAALVTLVATLTVFVWTLAPPHQ